MVKVFMPQHNSETIFNATDIIYNAAEYKLAHIHGKKKRGTGDTGLGIVEVPEPNNILHSRPTPPPLHPIDAPNGAPP